MLTKKCYYFKIWETNYKEFYEYSIKEKLQNGCILKGEKMMEIDKKYPKFNNWERDTLHGNSKGIMYMGVIVMIYLSISLLTDSRNMEMFVFTFSLLLIIWVPLWECLYYCILRRNENV